MWLKSVLLVWFFCAKDAGNRHRCLNLFQQGHGVCLFMPSALKASSLRPSGASGMVFHSEPVGTLLAASYKHWLTGHFGVL